MTSEMIKTVWLDNSQALSELCERCSNLPAIAVDTEFMRSSTFYPKIGLLQINDGEQNFLIDPLVFDTQELEPLRELWRNTAVVKVLHACSEDLEVFQHWLGVVPQPLFDTQMAANYAACGFSLSYAKLVQQFLDLELEKGETRSDWLKRPLSESQCHYAALDVEYLLDIYQRLSAQLEEKQRLGYLQEDCQRLLDNAQAEFDPMMAYLKVKSAWRLSSRSLGVLQALCVWREEQARERDIPRNRLCKDPQLFTIAKRPPKRVKDLARIEGLPGRTLREDGETIVQIVEQVLEDNNQWPESLTRPLSVEQGQQLKMLREHGHQLADSIGLAPELLFNKKEWEELIRYLLFNSPLQSSRFQGWRGKEFLPLLLRSFRDRVQ
ncbi:ribonuclease D [Pseudoteredinibacter isoporae]|uniref:ribonuclease D n=1 Tax=Pseudoteredinibacter isoporae TaxID=570281 RepID=UPI00310ABB8D